MGDATEDTQVISMSVVDKDATKDKEEEEKVFYKEAFEAFDWNRNGTIPTGVSIMQDHCRRLRILI